MIVITVILLVISVVSCTYFFYILNNKVDRLFAQLAVKNDNTEVIKAIESIDVKVDNSDVIKTIQEDRLDNLAKSAAVIKVIEEGLSKIIVKVDNSTKTVTDILENLTIEIQD